jgi:hypothetical protein
MNEERSSAMPGNNAGADIRPKVRTHVITCREFSLFLYKVQSNRQPIDGAKVFLGAAYSTTYRLRPRYPAI